MQPEIAVEGSAVAQLAAAAFGSNQPGKGAFHHRAVLAVDMAELGVVDPVSAV
ncbi:MAG: hypothetical protein M3257_03435 [Actinomycetota bacterium]|nr:hypothetical protein [Actinomycetota bacterium]